MRIAMVNNSRGWGGAEEIMLLLATRLQEQGHYVGVFLRDGSSTVAKFKGTGLAVWPIKRDGAGVIGGVARMLRIVRQERFDLIHAHRNHDLVVAKLAALAAGTPLLLTQHCQLGKTSSLFINLPNKVVAVSQFIGSDMVARYPSLAGKLQVIHNGIDLRPFMNPRPRYWANIPEVAGASPLLGVVGYFYKNQEELIDLLPRIRESLPKVKLIIIGKDDAKKPALEERARERGVADAVYFAGKIPYEQMPDALAGLDFNVSAFRREGCALNVIEALAVGTPFVGYRAGSYPELVEDGVTGALADDQDAFVRAVVELWERSECRETVREEAKKSALNRFSAEIMIGHYESLYQACSGERAV